MSPAEAMLRLALYGTSGCHLCEEALELLRHCTAEGPYHCQWETFDIADDPELLARYGVRIPVLYEPLSGTDLGWPFDAAILADWLAARQDCRPASSTP